MSNKGKHWKQSDEARRHRKELHVHPWNYNKTNVYSDKTLQSIRKNAKMHAARYWLNKKRDIETNEKVRVTLERLYREGKIKVWNKDLTKETDERIKKMLNNRDKKYLIDAGKRLGKSNIGKISNKKYKTYNEIYGKEKAAQIKATLSKSQKLLFKNDPTRVYRCCISRNRGSKQQHDFYEMLKASKLFITVEENVPIAGKFADIVIENLKLIVEYDGHYRHNNPFPDIERDKVLNSAGYKVIHFHRFIPHINIFLWGIKHMFEDNLNYFYMQKNNNW